jgi:acetolactate decarboxylase
MSGHIIDDRMLGALHLRALDHRGFTHDPAVEHVAFQTGTLNALMNGGFDGDTTIGELLARGNQGIGTIDALNGELVIVDGEAFVVHGDGAVVSVPPETGTPFAVVCSFAPFASVDLNEAQSLDDVRARVESLAGQQSFVAVRVDGEFADLRLRSVHGQTLPYPSLTEVTRHQTEWSIPSARGTLVGFRFPDRVAGVEVPGYHLHFLSDDRTCGGHVLGLTLIAGRVSVDGGNELHVELPAGVSLGEPGRADRSAIREAEGG